MCAMFRAAYETAAASGTGTCTIIAASNEGFGLVAYGTTVPSDNAAGFETGCLFLHTDGGAGTALYCNEGTSAACNFDAVTVA